MIAAALCLASALAAQVDVPRASEIIEVRVTNIDVVVVDEKGQRVHGLTKDDFEVHDGGKRQEITNLSEIGGSALPAGGPAEIVPPRHIVIFFDSVSTGTLERGRVASALADLVRGLRTGEDAMVVSWNRRIKVWAQPTADRVALESALQSAGREASLGSAQLSMFDDKASGLEQRRRMREAASDLTESVRGLEGILTRLAGLDGRKALVLVSSAFSFHPGQGSVDMTDPDAQLWLEKVDAPAMLRRLTASANSAGVVIYTIQGAGLESGMSVEDRSAGRSLERMRAAGSDIDGLMYLAERTGGIVTANTNAFRRAVERINEDLASYYSIGYRATSVRRDGERAVDVRTRNRSCSVRSRHSAVERSFETEAADRVLAALFFPVGSNDLGISARVLNAKQMERKRYAVPVDVKIPIATLAFTPDGEDLVADLSVFIASAGAAGAISDVQRVKHRVTMKRDQLGSSSGKTYTYGLNVDLRSETDDNRVAIAVIDNVSKAIGVVAVDVKVPR